MTGDPRPQSRIPEPPLWLDEIPADLTALAVEAGEHDDAPSSMSWANARPWEKPARLAAAAGFRDGAEQSVKRAGFEREEFERYLADPGPDASDIHSAEPDAPSGRNELIRFTSARELAVETPATTQWAWHGYLAFGATHELISPPKAGKTTLLAIVTAALVDGRAFLDRPTARTPVVVLTEQGPASFLAVLDRVGLTDRDDVRILLWTRARGIAWPEIVTAAVAECRRAGARVLIIDTLPAFAGIRGDGENDAGTALTAMEPLQTAAVEHGLAILVVRHSRKGGAVEIADAGRGSSAFSGAVDVVLRLARKDGASRPTIRVLSALSRFDDTPAELVIERTEQGYIVLGDELDYEIGRAREAIRDALADSPDGLTMKDLADQSGMPRSTLQLAIAQLADRDGQIERTGRGVRGDPHRFRAVSVFVSAAPLRGSGLAETNTDPPVALGPEPDLWAEAQRIFGDILAEPETIQ